MPASSVSGDKAVLELTLAPNEGYRSVLQNPSFVALWVAQLFSQIADRVVFVVFIALIVSHYGPKESYTSLLYIAFTIPAILLTAVAGVFVDRWPRRATLVATNVFRALFVGFLPMAAEHGLASIYLLAFLLSGATQFFVPAEAATIPMLLRKSQLMAANSLFTTTMIGSVIFGFALGDPLINIFSLGQVHWALVALFSLAAITVAFVNPPAQMPVQPEPRTRQQWQDSLARFRQEIGEGVGYIRSMPLLLQAMLKLALLFSGVVAMCILAISFAKAYLYTDPLVAAQKFAYIITYSGIGMILGALLVGNLWRNAQRSWLVFGGFTLMGTSLLVLSLAGWIPQEWIVWRSPLLKHDMVYLAPVGMTTRMIFTYGVAALMGIGVAMIAIPLQALIHELIPEDKRGKILGVQFTILSTASTLPVLAAGVGAEYLGVQWMLWLIGLPMLFLGLWGGLNRLGGLRHGVAADW